MIRKLMPIALIALSGCGAPDNDPGVGGVTAGEAQALNDAAEMLDQSYANTAAALNAAEAPANATNTRR